jgi:RHS repeat-associated protein
LTIDTLGSPRINTDAFGLVKARHDYMPFGEEIASSTGGRNSAQGYGGGDSIRQKFTQKERDIESDLDFFNARYYSSALGRFTSADTFGGKLTNPQSLNLYSYVMNNPLKWIDPTGHRAQDPNDPIKPTEDKDENGETIYVETDPEIIKVDVPGKRVESGVGQPGFWESMIPIWGSGRAAVDDFQNGRYVWGTINGAFAISDVFLVKSIVTAPVKVIGKTIFKEAATETATKTTQRVIVKEALKESDVAVTRLATEGGDFTNLYRTVSPAELDDILKSGNAFRNPPGIEVKYFSSTPEGAASYAQQTFGTGLYQGPYTIVGTQIQTNLIDSSMKVTVDRGIQTVVVPTQHLPALRPAQPFNFTPLPPKLPH